MKTYLLETTDHQKIIATLDITVTPGDFITTRWDNALGGHGYITYLVVAVLGQITVMPS